MFIWLITFSGENGKSHIIPKMTISTFPMDLFNDIYIPTYIFIYKTQPS